MSWDLIEKLASDVNSGDKTATELVEMSLEAISKHSDYNALISVVDSARARAKEIDEQVKSGKSAGRLAGVPFIAKDNFLTKGTDSTAASNILKGHNPSYTATSIEKLETEGAILVAKANMDSFGHGASTENSDFGPSKNPVDPTKVPGGSSGGSATSVVLGLAPFALGTDTGGSIRQPSSLGGNVGLKPTYGLVSRYGVMAMASSTDVIGVLANSVEDTALVFDVIAGEDPRDSTLIQRDEKSYTDYGSDIKGKKFGIIEQYMQDGTSQDVKEAIESAAKKIESAGGVVETISIPSISMGLAAYYIIMPAEVSSNLSRYDGVRYQNSIGSKETLDDLYLDTRSEGFNSENKRRVMIGNYVLSSGYYDAYYKKAQTVRTKLINEFNSAIEGLDFLIGPTAPNTAFNIGEKNEDPLQMYMQDIMTVTFSLLGVPAINVPVAKSESLPVGMQIVARQGEDRKLLGAASAVEKVVGYEQ